MFEWLKTPAAIAVLALLIAIVAGALGLRTGLRLGRAQRLLLEQETDEARQEKVRYSDDLAMTRKLLAEAEAKLYTAEARLTPRAVSNEQREQFLSLSAHSPKGPVRITMFGTDPETFKYAKQLQRVLIDAGYHAGAQIGQLQISGDAATGVRVAVASNDQAPPHARPLVRCLLYIGVPVASVVDRRTGADEVMIVVGSKESV